MSAILNQNISLQVDDLKQQCITKMNDSKNRAWDSKDWMIVAAMVMGVVLFIASLSVWGIYGDSMLTLAGKIGFGLVMGSVSMWPLPTIAGMIFYPERYFSVNYQRAADLVDRNLVEFANQNDIQLTPDNIF